MAKVERGDTVRKGVRVTLRACIWPLYWVQNGPDRPVWVPCGPAFRVPPELFGQFLNGVLGSSQRSEPSGGRGFPCFPSREELAYGQEQAHKREYDEHDLVDVIFPGRQPANEVCCPE